jgi:hypothetical protein
MLDVGLSVFLVFFVDFELFEFLVDLFKLLLKFEFPEDFGLFDFRNATLKLGDFSRKNRRCLIRSLLSRPRIVELAITISFDRVRFFYRLLRSLNSKRVDVRLSSLALRFLGQRHNLVIVLLVDKCARWDMLMLFRG